MPPRQQTASTTAAARKKTGRKATRVKALANVKETTIGDGDGEVALAVDDPNGTHTEAEVLEAGAEMGMNPAEDDGEAADEAETAEVIKKPQDYGEEVDQKAKEKEYEVLMEKQVGAFLGFARIDLATPPADNIQLRWGRMNKRSVDPVDVEKLLINFEIQGRVPSDHPVALMVNREWIDESEPLTKLGRMPFKDMPFLKFRPGIGAIVVNFLSGNHRRAACEQMIKDKQKKITELTTRIATKTQQRATLIEKENAGTVQKGAVAQTRRRKQKDEWDAEIAEFEKQKKRLETEIEGGTVWVAEVYNQELVDTQLERHLSANESRPQRPATKEELLFKAYFHLQDHLAIRKANKLVDPTPGTTAWQQFVLLKAFHSGELTKLGFQFMFGSQIGLDLLQHATRFSYFQDGKVLTVDMLKKLLHRMTKNNAKKLPKVATKTAAKPPVKAPTNTKADDTTGGYMWADLFNRLVGQMEFIAGSAIFPMVDADTMTQADVTTENQNEVALVNFFFSHLGKPLLVEPDVMSSCGLTTLATPKAMAHGQAEQASVMKMRYDTAMAVFTGPIHEDVWSVTLLEKIDEHYVTARDTWRKRTRDRNNIGDATDPDWRNMMMEYWSATRNECETHWQECKTQLLKREGSKLSDPAPLAFSNALRRLDWIFQRRREGLDLNLPWPTATFLTDMATYVQSAPEGLATILRMVDPMCDSVIRRIVDYDGHHDVIDCTGYMASFMCDSGMFRMSRDNLPILWQWLMNNYRSIVALDVVVKTHPRFEDWSSFFQVTEAAWTAQARTHPPMPAQPQEEFAELLNSSPGDFGHDDRLTINRLVKSSS